MFSKECILCFLHLAEPLLYSQVFIFLQESQFYYSLLASQVWDMLFRLYAREPVQVLIRHFSFSCFF